MAGWKILITDGLEESGQARLRLAGQVDDRNGMSSDELLAAIAGYDALIVRGRTKVTQTIIQAGSCLKVIGRAGVGVDNIDLAAAFEGGIAVVNTPVSTTLAVAELVLGLLFALAREIPRADAGMKQGQWLKKELSGIELNGKTLGIIGMGNIGAAVAQRALALGMNVVGYDALLSAGEIQQRSALPLTLEEVYAQSDFLTIHTPLLPETRHMLNAHAFDQMKPGVRIVCAARGGIIDEEALIRALQSGQVAGAALDVFTQEPPGSTQLVTNPRVIATPHIGAQTSEAQERAAQDIADEVLAALQDKALRWRVA